MTTTSALVIVASWEPRFCLGLEQDLAKYKPTFVKMLYYEEYRDWTVDSRARAEIIFRDQGIEFEAMPLSFGNVAETWKRLRKGFREDRWRNTLAVLDISTMPRETIWSLLYFLSRTSREIRYVYWEPERYGSDPLSSEPGRPRLVYKQSGITRLGIPTCLLVLSGFDPMRTQQLILTYEPQKILIGLQLGRQFENEKKNIEIHRKLFSRHTLFDINAYGDDHGYKMIVEQIEKYQSECNIVASSLGPKLSAIALFRAWENAPDGIALAYAPSNTYSRQYSDGIGRAYEGSLSAVSTSKP